MTPTIRKAGIAIGIVVALVVVWIARDRWDDRRLQEHCREMVALEADLETGTRVVRGTQVGDVVVDDQMSPAERARALRNVRAEIDECVARKVDI